MPPKKTLNQTKTWSSRFNEPVADLVKQFTASVSFDRRLADYDIIGSIAHSRMLADQEIISETDYVEIKNGLEKIQKEIKKGDFEWSIDAEDVHLNIEKRLIELIGEAGKKLHTGRSRNDQVATDIRLYLREAVHETADRINNLQLALVKLASENINTIMPGFTHLQVAQPITFGHHLMAYYEMLKRDKERLIDCEKRVNTLPLGGAALAGTSYNIKPEKVAIALGFNRICNNSLDSVSDRDFAIEYCSFSAILLMHLSRICEEIVLWMTPNFQFITLPDRLCTGSSIMPQKKNPDVPELVRGKTGRVNGNLIALLTLMKSQPLAYNKDNQEDKEPLFDSVDTVLTSLIIFEQLINGIKVNSARMKEAVKKGHATATDLADSLVKKGVSFREAHGIVANVVHYAESQNIELADLPLKKLREFCPMIDNSIKKSLSILSSVNSKNHIGGTSPQQVGNAIQSAKLELEEFSIMQKKKSMF